jgi:hypothetical protein
VDLSLMWSTHRPLPAVAQRFMELIGKHFAKLSQRPPERT